MKKYNLFYIRKLLFEKINMIYKNINYEDTLIIKMHVDNYIISCAPPRYKDRYHNLIIHILSINLQPQTPWIYKIYTPDMYSFVDFSIFLKKKDIYNNLFIEMDKVIIEIL